MSDSNAFDESDLIDFIRGQLDEPTAQAIRQRLDSDEVFRRRLADVKHTLGALDLMPAPQPRDDLVERTLQRIASVQRTNALIAAQQLAGRTLRPTFSLRELGAIAAILVVMAGVMIPALREAYQQSDRALCAAGMGQIGSALQTYAINNDGLLPAAFDHPTADRWLQSDHRPVASNSRALFKLLGAGYLHTPVVFQCPDVGGSSFVITDEMTDFPEPQYIHYSYQYSLAPPRLSISDPTVAAIAGEMVILADQNPLFVNGRFLPDRLDNPVSTNHDGDGQNVLYIDGHVAWAVQPTAGVDGDNIYLVDHVSDYDGDEHPGDATDTFLMPAHPGR